MSLEDSAAETGRPRTPALSEMRDVSDARTLRALTHPVRIALIEALGVGGAMTATQLGEQIGESPTTCSFHLRQLAKYGFVEEAGGGKGRARPWKMTSIGMHIRGIGDPEAEIAAATLGRLVTDRQIARYQAWARSMTSYPREWRDASSTSEWILFLTPDELQQLNDELAEVIFPRFRERFTDPSKRPPGALPVEYLLFSYPIAVPGADPGSAPESSAPESSAPESSAPESGEPTA
jgi:DNA-binding MarR family transcriptional regulator